MSYILDALQKSEHERRQKQQSVQVNPFEEQEFSPSRSKRWYPWVLIVILLLVLCILAGVLWWQLSKTSETSAQHDELRVPTSSLASNALVGNNAQVSHSLENNSLESNSLESNGATPTNNQGSNLSPAKPSQDKVIEEEAPTRDKNAVETKRDSEVSKSAEEVVAKPVSSEVKRLYAQSERRRERESVQQVEQTLSQPPVADVNVTAVNGGEDDNSEIEASANSEKLDTDAIVAAALTQLQGGVAPPDSRVNQSESDDESDVRLSGNDAATVDLTSELGSNPSTNPSTNPSPSSNNPTTFPTAAELPQGVQDSLPTIKYTSHMYSSSTKKGFVVINGGKFIQGESVAPGVFIEKIQDEGVVLSFGGHLFFQEAMTDWEKP